MDAPLQGDTGGHTGAAPTHLHQTTQCAPYRAAVILSIAQGWQVQRAYPG